MIQDHVVSPVIWNSSAHGTPEKFSAHLYMSSHNFPLRFPMNFSTLLRNTSERSKVFAQRKCTIRVGEVELLKFLAVFYQNKQPQGLFQKFNYACWALKVICCCMFRVTDSLKPSSLLALKFSWALILILCSCVFPSEP